MNTFQPIFIFRIQEKMLGASVCELFYFGWLVGFLSLNSGMSWFCVLVTGVVAERLWCYRSGFRDRKLTSVLPSLSSSVLVISNSSNEVVT